MISFHLFGSLCTILSCTCCKRIAFHSCVWLLRHSCPNRVILCLHRARKRCLYMYVLNVIHLTNIIFFFVCLAPSIHLTKQGDSIRGNETLSLHVCIKSVSFEENGFAPVAIKCQIVFVSVTRRCRSDVVHSLPFSW